MVYLGVYLFGWSSDLIRERLTRYNDVTTVTTCYDEYVAYEGILNLAYAIHITHRD